MLEYGFVRVAGGVPRVRVADCPYNAERILGLMKRAEEQGAAVLVLPELSLTGYTCGDLFQQPVLQRATLHALDDLVQKSVQVFAGITILGCPLVVDDQLYNCAVAFQQGRLLGIVPKSYLPNYKEFYEARWFAPGTQARNQALKLLGQEVPFGTDLLLDGTDAVPGFLAGVEICEDLWVPIPPSTRQALAGATLLINLSASNEVIGKAAYRRQLVANQAGRCLAAYLYVSCGVHESTTDLVFGGHCLLAENGTLLAETPRFQRDEPLLCVDVDVERLVNERQKTNSFGASQPAGAERPWRRLACMVTAMAPTGQLQRAVEAHPFVPRGEDQLEERCQEIFHTQVAGLAKRLEHIGKPALSLGVSGGLDSTLALLVAAKTLDLLGWPRTQLHGITMPGFGTSGRTLNNARALMRMLRVQSSDIDIRQLCLEEMRALGHRPFGIDLTGLTVEQLTVKLRDLPGSASDLVFENVQARMRTSLLMNKAFVIGTGDLSELALGWCTYNGDHMSMYNPNCSIPKTLVKFLVRWVAENEFDDEAQRTLLDIVSTEISPELLPMAADGTTTQSTEGALGPYEVHDFYLFHFLRYGAPPEKILFLAQHAAFDQAYSAADLRRWLQVFIQRFFTNQFKRSCLPDGPKVGSISLSPRGDWRMPSDAQARIWLDWARS